MEYGFSSRTPFNGKMRVCPLKKITKTKQPTLFSSSHCSSFYPSFVSCPIFWIASIIILVVQLQEKTVSHLVCCVTSLTILVAQLFHIFIGFLWEREPQHETFSEVEQFLVLLQSHVGRSLRVEIIPFIHWFPVWFLIDFLPYSWSWIPSLPFSPFLFLLLPSTFFFDPS